MKTGKSLIGWAGCIAVFAIVLFFRTAVNGNNHVSTYTVLDQSLRSRTDIIVIDTLKTLGKHERPDVLFLHDLHTDTLEKQGKDCTACHHINKNKLSIKFKQLADPKNKEAVTKQYHDYCIGCHKETASSGNKTGPAECGKCHAKTNNITSDRIPIVFDKSIHFRHSKAYDKKCEKCHHEYSERSKTLFYAKGKEGSCQYCHLSSTEKNVISMRAASHTACVDCHRDNEMNKKKTGPVKCSGCHEAQAQAKIKKFINIPRMDRKQPEVVFLHSGDKNVKNVMDLVPFDHKTHEENNDTCIACHHKSLEACSKCHTLSGTKTGQYVRLEQAMHSSKKERSCIGCHDKVKNGKDCAGCHSFMAKKQDADEENCRKCHSVLPSKAVNNVSAVEFLNPSDSGYNLIDIPEKIIIKKLADKYQPVDFPHRKIVSAISNNLEDSRLAKYFHSEKGTLCKGCHHNTPAAKKPVSCSCCHSSKSFDEKDMHKPGLKGAYHIQCMECHKNMEIEKPVGCTECHKKK